MTEKKIHIKNLNINYKKFGIPGAPIFLILHGWGGDSSSWIKVAECLKNDYEIYAIDFPWFGKSEPLKQAWDIDNYADLIETFVNELNIKEANIIAHSFGGRVGIKLASKNHPWIKKLYLCDAAGIKHPLSLKQKIAAKSAGLGKKIFSYKLLKPLENFSRKTLYKIIREQDYYKCKNEIMKKTFQNIIAEDLKSYLKIINIPTIIIWGEKDKYTPLSDAYLMNKEIKNSKLHIIKGVGHGIHLYASDKLCRLIKSG